MKCRFTRDRIIITSIGIFGVIVGIALLIPGIILATDSSEGIELYLSVNLCETSLSDDEDDTLFNWVVQPTIAGGNQTCPSLNANATSLYQDIVFAPGVIEPNFPYVSEVQFSWRVQGQFSFALMQGDKVIEHTGILDIRNLEHVDLGDAEKPFDICGGEDMQIYRESPYTTLSGYFPDGTQTCPDQNVGCKYEPSRSIMSYHVDSFDFELDSVPTSDSETPLVLRIEDVELEDPVRTAPDFFIKLESGASGNQTAGWILIIIGVILIDVCPGIAYFFLTRVKPPRRTRANIRLQ
mmetsp:Transcript_20198/g.30024  ORF Transcript_20198/g.30024 Transcript_20198/m.30024 type:complete len:295 (+) Transcript_20198:39-923(+)|eukprot:CAMPEP_0201546416 /NCGR_PEP_ID=MMETSP0173_2-20130828/2692_1 /ASSEMBLY_ACC=CAM_ASM_000268 /TAXON_ID=218659 /ORGANISM="Vexillifera sp., Strain DIVA3 564/2" /LENGTH=294 /DNA_ID=CAMNT_0047955059 /DNA_START=40 /DNA_END=924 /DNA_ORIENTATION=-